MKTSQDQASQDLAELTRTLRDLASDLPAGHQQRLKDHMVTEIRREEPTRPARRGEPRAASLLRRRRRRALLILGAGVSAACAAAALTAIGLSAGGGRPPASPGAKGPGVVLPPIQSRAGLPSAAAMGQAMVTAFSAASDDILYSTEAGTNHGVLVDVYRTWSWPAQPVTGQQELWRNAYWQRIRGTAPLNLTEDDGFAYRTPPAGWNNAYGQLTVVCYAGTGQTGCGYDNTETPPGSWSLRNGWFVNPNPGLDDLSPAVMAQAIANGQWRVAGRTHVDGQPAIELNETQAGHYEPLPTFLWVNARTHLPLRMIQGAGKPGSAQFDWHFLRPTTANLALLRVPIPAGYTRSGSSG
jgi:hypothetical protein